MVQRTISMQLMRYINLFEKVSKVSTTKCFIYNRAIIFAVPEKVISKAIGKTGINVKKLNKILGKKIKIIAFPKTEKDIDKFIAAIINPVEFSKLQLDENKVLTISANKQNKAALIGRNRIREKELEEILKKFFDIKKLKIA